MARHCMPQKQTHQIAITALRRVAPVSGGLGPGRCGRAPSLAIALSSVSTSSTNTSTSANASHRPGDVLAGRTAVPIVCGLGTVDDDCAMACRPPGRHLQSNPRLQSCQHRLARDHYKQTLKVLIHQSLNAVGRTDETALTAFTEGCAGLRRILTDVGIAGMPMLDWFHIGMRLQHLKQTASSLSAHDPARVAAKAVIV